MNIVYGALCAMAQSDLKKLIAYSSVSHMGFVLLGIGAMNAQGFSGGLFQMFNHGTVTAMLFLLVGVIYDRAHHRQIDGFGGLATSMPRYAAFTGFAFFAALGLPTLSSFVSELLCLLGGFLTYPLWTMVGATGVVLGAYAAESLGDYCSGTNHVLPTNGAARGWSGVSLASFLNFISVQEVSAAGLRAIGPCAVTLAGIEGLDAHANAVRLRLERSA